MICIGKIKEVKRSLKKVKKLLTSTLSLGLVLGNMGGTVVEATSALHSIELPALRQLRPQEEKEQEETNEEENKPRASTLPRLPIETQEKEELRMENVLQESRLARWSREEIQEEAINFAARLIEYRLNEAMKKHNHSFTNGEMIEIHFLPQIEDIFNMPEGIRPNFPSNALHNNTVIIWPHGVTNDVQSSYTESGNWRYDLSVRGTAWDTQSMTLTRIGNQQNLGTETMEIRLILALRFDSSGPVSTNSIKTINFLSAAQAMGELGVEAKDGPHYLWIGNDLPDPSSYVEIDQSNVKWDLKTEWEIPPRMFTAGTQNTRIKVTEDRSGRTATVNVPITVQSRDLQVTGKAGPHSIYVNEAIPNPADYFDVRDPLGQTHQLEWLDADTSSAGTKTWRAKATAADGREATGSITMDVLPQPEVELKLQDVENRHLGGNYPTLSSSFREYIQEATMEGQRLNTADLEFVTAESTEPDYSIVGEQPLKLTVHTRHPVTGRMIKGTAETKVNVRWGDTFLLKAHNGQSAGAYAFQLRNGNNARIVATRGLDSPLDERIGLEDSLYYSIEVLRNDRQAYYHEVPGRATLQQVITTFGNGNGYLDVQLGDIINIQHPQKSAGSSVLMVEEEEQDFTYGTDNAYYRVTAFGFEPLPVLPDPAIQLKLKPMEDRSLGETSASLASTFKNYIEEATFEGESVAVDDLEFVAAESTEPTNTIAGKQDIRITVQAKHPISGETIKGTAETSVNYLWGDTFMIKSSEGGSAGAFPCI